MPPLKETDIKVAEEYPTDIPDRPTFVFLRGSNKLLVHDSGNGPWIEFQGKPMEVR